MFFSSLFFYNNVITEQREVTKAYDTIRSKIERLDNIQSGVVNVFRHIDQFLLDPLKGEHDRFAKLLISDLVQNIAQWNQLVQKDSVELSPMLSRLEEKLIKVDDIASQLVKSRMDVNIQYPGMAIAANFMTESQRAVGNQLQLLIDEIESGELEPKSAELYPLLLKTYTLWIQHISQVRIYLANRFASFSIEVLSIQATSLYDLNAKFIADLEQLAEIYSKEDSFEGSSLVKAIKANSEEWMEKFADVRAVSESEGWRTDNFIMQSQLFPTITEINRLIRDIEKRLLADEKLIGESMKESTETVSTVLFAIIALFMLSIFAIIFSLDKIVFRPILAVVNALKSTAFNREAPKLSDAKSREIGQLVAAYINMDEQVTQRQEELQENEQLLLTMAENYPNAFVSIINSDYTIGFTSGQEFKKLDLEPEQFIGKTLESVFGEQVEYVKEQYSKSFAGEECTFELFNNDQYQLYRAVPLYANDNTIPQILVVIENITERKLAAEAIHESAKRFRIIFEGAPEGVWVIGPNRITIEVNSRLCDMLGYQREEMIGKTPLDFADDENQKIFKQQTAKIELTERREYEIELQHKDGHNVATKFSATTLHSSSGGVLEAVAFVTDMTELKVAEKALRRAQKMDAIGQLTGGIAHDFNNILGIILGNLDLLERMVDVDVDGYSRISSIRKATERAIKLTKQLLGFSRNKSAQQSVTNINRVVEDMDSLIARSITPQIQVEHHFMDELWSTEIDPGDFEDAVLNLALNARDAMEGHGRLTIETRNTTLDETYCFKHPNVVPGDYVELAISDSGKGIPYAQQERIFEPFYTTKEVGKGTGLGLAMVFGFAKRSNGSIDVYSEPDIGTTFRLYLPRVVRVNELNELSNRENEILPRGGETILAVDDELGLLELTQELLEAQGYRVLTASDGNQALDILNSEADIDMLFSDVVMPGGINGYELAERATSVRPELKVLLTSGYTERAVVSDSQSRFEGNLLSKPYSQLELAKRIRSTLGMLEDFDTV